MSQAAYQKALQIKTTGSTVWLDLNANDATMNLGSELLDDTDFTSTGYRSRIAGIKDYSLDVSAFWDSSDTAFNTVRSALLAGTKLDFRYLPDGSNGFTGTVLVETFGHSGGVGDLESVEITMQSAAAALTTV